MPRAQPETKVAGLGPFLVDAVRQLKAGLLQLFRPVH